MNRSNQRGAVLIESAFSLILLMALAAVFWETVYVMLSHQRTTYAAYIAERSRVVGGDAILAGTMVGGGIVEPSSDGTRVWEQLDLPLGLNFLWAAGGTHGIGDKHPIVERTVTLPTEPEDTGDNAYMPVFVEGDLMAYQALPVPIGGFVGLPGTEDAGRIVAGTPSPSGSGSSGTVTKAAHPIGGGSGTGGGGLYPSVPGYGDDGSGNGGNPNSCPANEPGSDGHGETRGVGNPIDVTNGNKYQREVDIRYSGDVYANINDSGNIPQSQGQSYSTQLPLLFSRHYNSIYEVVGALGGGWRHGYEVSLHVKGNRLPVEQDPLLLLQQGDGRWIRFERTQINQNQLIYRAESRDDGWLSMDNSHYRWYWRDGRELLFDAQGRLLRISAPNGDTQQLYYDEHHRLMSVEDSYGREFNLKYNNKGLLAQITASDGEVVKYRYSETSQLTNVEYADKTTKVYHYEDQRDSYNLTGITDERGIRYSTYEYDHKDRAVMSTRANNVGKVSLSFKANKQTGVTDSLGRQSTYTWKELGLNRLITEVKGPGCSSCGQGDVIITYNDTQQTIKKTTRSGITHTYEYDELGRRTEIKQHSRTNQQRLIAQYSYISKDQLTFSPLDTLPTEIKRPSVKAGAFHRHGFSYTQEGQLSQLTEQGFRPQVSASNPSAASDVMPAQSLPSTRLGAGIASDVMPAKAGIHDAQIDYEQIERTTKYQYNKRGQLIQIDGPRDDVKDITKLTYYPQQKKGVVEKGRLHQVIDATNNISYQVNEYDEAGRVLEEQRNGLIATQYKYDKRGRIIKTQRGEQVSQREYAENGNLSLSINPDGTQSHYEYDEANRAIRSISHNGEISVRELDTENNLLRTQLLSKDGELLRQSSTVYDAYDHPIEIKDADGVVIQKSIYNESDLLTEVIDGNGNTTQYHYDDWNRKVETIRADNTEIQTGYDQQDRLISVTDPRQNETSYQVDDFGLRVAQLSADTGISRYRYDSSGNLTQKTSASGVSIDYEYDALNRKRNKNQSEGETTYYYDDQNQLTKVQGIHSTEHYQYDAYGRKINHVRVIEGMSFTTSYKFTKKTGQLMTKILPDGQKLEYNYYRRGKDRGELKSIKLDRGDKTQTLIEDVNYPNSNEHNYTYGNGITVEQLYNQKGQLTELNHEGILDLNYAYDVIGNIIEIDRNNQPESYNYDSLYQLTEANMASGEYQYSYDEVGNRIELNENNISTQYSYSEPTQGNHLLQVVNETYQYNLEGSPTQIGEQLLIYDSEQRLLNYLNQDKNIDANYLYNHHGERVVKEVHGNKTYFIYDNGVMIGEFDVETNKLVLYIWGPTGVLAKLDQVKVIYLHGDHLGTPQIATNFDKNIIWESNYHPFGNHESKNELIHHRFIGQYYDEERNTYYNYRRDYNPNLGRYQTADPIGLRGKSANIYGYVNQNPVNSIDPSGLECIPLGGWVPVTPWYETILSEPKWGEWKLINFSSMGGDGPAFWQVTSCICRRDRSGIRTILKSREEQRPAICTDCEQILTQQSRWIEERVERNINELESKIVKIFTLNDAEAAFKCEKECAGLNQ